MTLTPTEARVVATLMEKARTVPDSYPLTLNSLMLGCNQKTSRDPLLDLSEAQIATALDTPDPSFNEGQRADCAPRALGGDGIVNSGDVIQARRYATGLDPLTPAGGPAVPSFVPKSVATIFDDVYAFFFGRELRVASAKAESGQTVIVPVEIAPFGDETAVSFTLEYDPAKLSNPRLSLDVAAPDGSVLTVNSIEKGRIGILIDQTEAMTASTTPKRLVIVSFDVSADARGGAAIAITSGLAAKEVSSAAGNSLSTRWRDGFVRISDDISGR